jgi:polyferredoxin
MKVKWIRFFFQILFFLIIGAFFLGKIENSSLISIVNSVHVFPTLSKLMPGATVFLMNPENIYASEIFLTLFVFIFFLLITIVFGRVYCSFVCPAGFIQDLSRSFFKRIKRVSYKKITPIKWLRIVVFSLTIAFVLLNSSYYMFFDHYANLGRLFSLVYLELTFASVLGFLFFLVLIVMPIFIPRFFCTFFCPSGMLFSIIQKRSFMRVASKVGCNLCSLCEKVCPTASISKGQIDYSTCINCLECRDECRRDSFKIVFKKERSKENKIWKMERRDFFVKAASFFSSFLGAFFITKMIWKGRKLKACIPPGSLSKKHLFNNCISCSACKNICPTNVIEMDFFDNGAYGFLKPKMNYMDSYCSFECNACLSVCPTGALKYFPLKLKKQIKMGNASVLKKVCIPFLRDKDCGACAEQCPTGALTMEVHPRRSALVPVVNESYCIGCGACRWACPTLPERAIVVSPEEVHGVAYNPKQFGDDRAKEIIVSPSNEFPF